MIRNKKILSAIIAAVMASNIIVVNAFAAVTDEEIYKIAYDATVKALQNKSQKDINEARKAIEAIPLYLDWARGEFSKQVDTVQHPILVEIVKAIETARKTGTQKDINEARKRIPENLPSMWKAAYSEAIDKVQQEFIKKVTESIDKAKASKKKGDIKVAKELIEVLKTVENNDSVKTLVEKLSKEFEAFVKSLDKPDTESSKKQSKNNSSSTTPIDDSETTPSNGGNQNNTSVYNVACKPGKTVVVDQAKLNGAKTVNVIGNNSGIVRLQGINVDNIIVDLPNGEVVLDGVTVNNLDIRDVANNSLYSIRSTIIFMQVNDISNNAHIVMSGGSVGLAQINSGAILEATNQTNMSRLVLNNSSSAGTATLIGNLASTVVEVQNSGGAILQASVGTVVVTSYLSHPVSISVQPSASIGTLQVESSSVLNLTSGNGVSLANVISQVTLNVQDNNLSAIKNDVDNNRGERERIRGEILSQLNHYINGSIREEGDEKPNKDRAVLAILENNKEYLSLPIEFYNTWTDKERLVYAGSVRCKIKQETQPINYDKLNAFFENSKSDFKVLLEADKLAAHPNHGIKPNWQTLKIKVDLNSKNIDITDQVLALEPNVELNKITTIDILKVGEEDDNGIIQNETNFDIINDNGTDRIILKSVSRSLLNKELAVQIEIGLLNNTSLTSLYIKLEEDTTPLIEKINDAIVNKKIDVISSVVTDTELYTQDNPCSIFANFDNALKLDVLNEIKANLNDEKILNVNDFTDRMNEAIKKVVFNQYIEDVKDLVEIDVRTITTTSSTINTSGSSITTSDSAIVTNPTSISIFRNIVNLGNGIKVSVERKGENPNWNNYEEYFVIDEFGNVTVKKNQSVNIDIDIYFKYSVNNQVPHSKSTIYSDKKTVSVKLRHQ